MPAGPVRRRHAIPHLPRTGRRALTLICAAAALHPVRAQGVESPVPSASAASSPASSPLLKLPPIELRKAESLQAPARGEAARRLPILLRARELRARPDLDAEASGDVEFRRGGVVIRADRLTYEQASDLARATGQVVVSRDGNVFSGPELELKVERFEGFFRTPTYRFARTGGGGHAERIDFIDDQRAVATEATYSSCTIDDGNGDPVWILRARELRIDNKSNEGIARGAVLRFYGVPILASPVLTFPLNDDRKSGFLPPSIGLDSDSGLQVALPYYWNIAPNRDATFTFAESLRRGPSIGGEFRYLEPSFAGEVEARLMPNDNEAGRSRYSLRFDHEGSLPLGASTRLKVLRVSDDNYWKDFPREVRSDTPRLLQTDLLATRPFGDWTTYARLERWQVLQTEDPTTRIVSPYERTPQIGARYAAPWSAGFDLALETEFNRFSNPHDRYHVHRNTGLRVHALGSVARPFVSPGWRLTPRLSFNAASYSFDDRLADGRRSASRLVPTFSVDSAWTLERETSFFGRAVRQTLEPRLLYVNTPYRRQNNLPNFDAAGKDFNFDSIFTENTFSGVDRVTDSHQLTAGVTSRVLDPLTGAEALRLGIVQRYLFRDQRITPDDQPLTTRYSDVLVLGSTSLVPNWTFDASAQYNTTTDRVVRSVASFRYSPGPYRTVSLAYRLARSLSEQVELGWQWPLFGPVRSSEESERPAGSRGRCGGTLYSVGRVNYSTRDSRIIDSVIGFEYDAGCWIGRVVAERLSTGRSEATTRLLVQLELVGLSRLGSNPLKVLKDNVPGYQLLREDRTSSSPFNPYD